MKDQTLRVVDAMTTDLTRPRVYVASPLGFTAAGRLWTTQVLHPAVQRAGLVVADPWALPDPLAGDLHAALAMPPGAARHTRLTALNAVIGARNIELIDGCDGMLAVLDGVDLDSGTSSEVGYAAARIPVEGLRTDTRIAGDNEATCVNLQIAAFVAHAGGSIHTDPDAAAQALHRRFTSTYQLTAPPRA